MLALGREPGSGRRIVEVWAWNFDAEFGELLAAASACGVNAILALDTEFPGFLREEPPSAGRAVRYQALRENVDNLRPIQLGVAIAREDGTTLGTWSFNLRFDVAMDLHTEESVNFLTAAGLDFPRHALEGIDPLAFGRRLAVSPLVGRHGCRPRWVTFQGWYDLGYLLKLLTSWPLPPDVATFEQRVEAFCPRRKELRDQLPRGSLDSLIRDRGVERVGLPHTAGSDALATLELLLQLEATPLHRSATALKAERRPETERRLQEARLHEARQEAALRHRQETHAEDVDGSSSGSGASVGFGGTDYPSAGLDGGGGVYTGMTSMAGWAVSDKEAEHHHAAALYNGQSVAANVSAWDTGVGSLEDEWGADDQNYDNNCYYGLTQQPQEFSQKTSSSTIQATHPQPLLQTPPPSSSPYNHTGWSDHINVTHVLSAVAQTASGWTDHHGQGCSGNVGVNSDTCYVDYTDRVLSVGGYTDRTLGHPHGTAVEYIPGYMMGTVQAG